MTAQGITRVPAVGQAWSGDWRARIYERLRARGYDTVTAFAEAYQRASLKALAEELSTDHDAGINHADVAADQVVRIWREEAMQAGSEAIERFARRLLAGELQRDLVGGWITKWTETEASRAALRQLLYATSTWAIDVGKGQKSAADRVFTALMDNANGRIPPGWLPASADDPILVEIFRKHWREPG